MLLPYAIDTCMAQMHGDTILLSQTLSVPYVFVTFWTLFP